ncbi:MAG: FMN-binding negative transcriptional regulator [Hyphomicrobiales bacterium]|nr:FMN-binding negative transcriptional regulator [Hyphomicrobiales bacterium]
MSLYVPPHFRMDDDRAARRLIADHGFAVLTSQGADGPMASHLPLVLDDGGDVLLGHVSRANPHWRHFDGETVALAVFRGPHAYVSPRWMDSPGNVPTWNYTAVQVTGRPRVIDDAAAARGVLDRLVAQYEPDPGGWRTGDVPADRLAGLMKGIVAFAMPMESVTAKAKLSQNKSAADRAGVAAALRAAGAGDLADLMEAD